MFLVQVSEPNNSEVKPKCCKHDGCWMGFECCIGQSMSGVSCDTFDHQSGNGPDGGAGSPLKHYQKICSRVVVQSHRATLSIPRKLKVGIIIIIKPTYNICNRGWRPSNHRRRQRPVNRRQRPVNGRHHCTFCRLTRASKRSQYCL